jgi:glycosyltransferase involved in cell wall biosynthesis
MKVLQVLSSIGKAWGGPPKVVLELCSSLQQHLDITVLSTFDPNEPQYEIPSGVTAKLFPRNQFSRFWFGCAHGVADYVNTNLKGFDLVHLHELWSYPQYLVGKKAIELGIPIVISPHGHFHPVGMNRSKWKKSIFRSIYLDKLLHAASGLVVLTDDEAKYARNYVQHAGARIAVIPNGVANIDDQWTLPISGTPPYLLFCSRIHPQKGLEHFLDAYAGWSGKKDFRFKIAGPFDNAAYETQIRSQVVKLQLESFVDFVGPVFGSAKYALLAGASALVLTSIFEGLPTILLEAMQLGCPMIISDQCGIDGMLKAEGIALVSPPEAKAIGKNLETFQSGSKSLKARAAIRGPELVAENFSLQMVANRYLAFYQSIVANKGK